jgi:predicted ATPase
MVEAVLHANPAARVIATSREPLRAESECVYRVPPLAVPAEDTQTLEDVLRHGAAELFVARTQAADPPFSPDQQIAAAIAAICRRLDGIPLAIELAAARTPTLAVQELASRLDDCFGLLTEGRRTALPRHKTLRATLDWSYALLSRSERTVLRRLSIFAGDFTLKAAIAVVTKSDIHEANVIECVAGLVTKSLVVADVGGAGVRYWLLETTRAYAREKLAEHGELEQAARKHAEYYWELCRQAEAEWETRPAAEWLADYGREIGNVRAALDWAYSPSGDDCIGLALTAISVPLWFQLSLIDECRRRVEQALSRPKSGPSSDTRREMQLYAALGASLLYTKGPVRETGAAWTHALAIADRLEDTEYRLRLLRNSSRARCVPGSARSASQRGRAAETRNAGQVISPARGNLRREDLAKPPDRVQHLLLRQPWPLAAHDEVIDSQKLAIPRDLLFHRRLVADDEPAACEILERTLRSAVLQSP